jgi:hypothetical protein
VDGWDLGTGRISRNVNRVTTRSQNGLWAMNRIGYGEGSEEWEIVREWEGEIKRGRDSDTKAGSGSGSDFQP